MQGGSDTLFLLPAMAKSCTIQLHQYCSAQVIDWLRSWPWIHDVSVRLVLYGRLEGGLQEKHVYCHSWKQALDDFSCA